MELSEMLLGELTVEQYIVLIATFCGVLFGLIFIAVCLFGLIKEIFAFIEYFFRKDKYKSRDITVRRAYSYLAFLRNQVKKADTREAYLLLFNRLVAAYNAYVEIGVFSYNDMKKHIKIFDFRSRYDYKEYGEYYKIYDERAAKEKEKKCAADEVATAKESEEK